jgi:hypothetical protein
VGEFHEGYLKVRGGLQESLVRTGIMVHAPMEKRWSSFNGIKGICISKCSK